MNIKKSITLNYVEDLLENLQLSEKSIDIELPFDEINESNFSVFPSFVQFYSSWIRSNYSGELIIHKDLKALLFQKRDGELLEETITNYNKYLFVCSALSWSKGIILDSADFKQSLRKHNSQFNENSKNLKCFRASEMLLASFDFDRNLENRGLLRPLYDNNGFLRDELFFAHHIVPEMLTEVARRYSASYFKDSFTDQDILNLGKIIFELFKNTHEWGRSDVNSNINLSPNIRAIYINLHRSTHQGFLKTYKSQPALLNYFENPIFNKEGQLYFLEVSVFDSGIGFIKQSLGGKYSQDNISVADQVGIVKKCLTKYYTTATTLFSNNKGRGLDAVLRSLDKKGFLRIRTEGICIYRDMIKESYDNISIPGDIALFDWNSQSDKSFTKFPRTEGSVITLMYPLNITE